jgi:predicted nucleic acid-binding protein
MIRAYLDANIILAKSAGPDKEPRQFPQAEEIFNKIKGDEIQAVVSPLTLMEVKNALRINHGKETEILAGMNKPQRLEYVHRTSEADYNAILSELIRMGDKVIFNVNKNIDMNKLLGDAIEILSGVNGKTKTYKNCKKCGTNDVNYIGFKSVGTDDALHVLLAKEMDCDQFLTFDNDFNEIIGHTKIKPLKIQIIEQKF